LKGVNAFDGLNELKELNGLIGSNELKRLQGIERIERIG